MQPWTMCGEFSSHISIFWASGGLYWSLYVITFLFNLRYEAGIDSFNVVERKLILFHLKSALNHPIAATVYYKHCCFFKSVYV